MVNICNLTTAERLHISNFNCKNAFPIQAEEDQIGSKNLSLLVGWRTRERPYKFYFFSPALAKLWANHQIEEYSYEEVVSGEKIGRKYVDWDEHYVFDAENARFSGNAYKYYPAGGGWRDKFAPNSARTVDGIHPLISLIREIKGGLFTAVSIPDDILPYRADNPFPCNIQVANPPLNQIT